MTFNKIFENWLKGCSNIMAETHRNFHGSKRQVGWVFMRIIKKNLTTNNRWLIHMQCISKVKYVSISFPSNKSTCRKVLSRYSKDIMKFYLLYVMHLAGYPKEDY